ncbi:MAG: winged helix-turn-helix domain-containing protein, partial [Butyricimonas sp.]|nr:winged helix-turn-helix domain-containing protein [Butyricimonas sp.]
QLLCAKNQEVASREYLIEGVWGQANLGKASELKKYASRVRKLLKVDSSLKIEYRENGYILITEL